MEFIVKCQSSEWMGETKYPAWLGHLERIVCKAPEIEVDNSKVVIPVVKQPDPCFANDGKSPCVNGECVPSDDFTSYKCTCPENFKGANCDTETPTDARQIVLYCILGIVIVVVVGGLGCSVWKKNAAPLQMQNKDAQPNAMRDLEEGWKYRGDHHG
eukprot:10476_1